ncbi:cytochrome c oxidase subunit 3 [Aquiflexum gelatinilyticum]|uniref:Cytochrome c oxidase subunit 3 n=1 Tax=Aquiflexum gelatinilyticum TaxID=2961943 RepID=A0A9X2P455_9BACT|nr:cytochrome c oxidase subunit 3 [Aquiflexum gelatinilyticum]MCR9014356.1 cytochrome c oxidase subunit 3 [Aquiflexum gelatinilyticum]MCS4435796.1 cytochrome c oxidase subunit 3 [Aquiflexum gelatinilyticum]
MEKTKESWLQRVEKMHPYQTMMYLGMFGSGLIFLFLTVAFLASGTGYFEQYGHKIPKAFILSTFVILFSGYTVSKLLIYFNEENLEKLKSNLVLTAILGVIFTVLQFFGWRELTMMGVDFKGLPSGSFLYILSGIHIFHLLGVMIFSIIMLVQYNQNGKSEIQQILMLTNPFEKMRIRLFTTYWHFMDLIWLVLFLVFVLTF